jgi:hypothetical protein
MILLPYERWDRCAPCPEEMFFDASIFSLMKDAKSFIKSEGEKEVRCLTIKKKVRKKMV